MKNIKSYNKFLILEKFDDNIIEELKRLGITDKEEINKHLYHAHRGNLAKYLQEKGRKFTFGMLYALFLDAQAAKKKTDLRVGVAKAVHRVFPMLLAPFFPVIAIVGYILGTSRAFNKVIAPILADPGKDYPAFLNKLITSTMKIAEGEIVTPKDRFSRAFVVSDNLVDAIKEDVLREFAVYLSNKMSRKNPDEEVPEHFIENQLKSYLNKRFDVDPEIPLREQLQNKTFENVNDVISKCQLILIDLEDYGLRVDINKYGKELNIFITNDYEETKGNQTQRDFLFPKIKEFDYNSIKYNIEELISFLFESENYYIDSIDSINNYKPKSIRLEDLEDLEYIERLEFRFKK